MDKTKKYSNIKALSIRQPWAWLIANGYKDIENRDWRGRPKYRGHLLIHAGKTFERDAVGLINSILWDEDIEVEQNGVRTQHISENRRDYRRGGFVGLCRLNDVVDMDDSPWFFGPLGFKIRMPQPIEFIPYPGSLGLFDVPDEIISQITPLTNNQSTNNK